jgi:AcrR family transcriptional regulator
VVPRVYKNSKNEILDAAERVILRDGPGGLSVDAVLLEAGVSKGGFFHHFATKEALLGALLERLSAAVAERATASIGRDAEPFARSLRGQIALAFDMPRADRERTRALVLALLAAVMEAPAVAKHARVANERSLSVARAEGVDAGIALVVQLALDGYFLSESFGTLRLDKRRKTELRETLLGLLRDRRGC